MRRFTRLTSGFSKKFENHAAMGAVHSVYYNFARIHRMLRCTPAQEAGLSDHVWTLEEIVTMADGYMRSRESAGRTIRTQQAGSDMTMDPILDQRRAECAAILAGLSGLLKIQADTLPNFRAFEGNSVCGAGRALRPWRNCSSPTLVGFERADLQGKIQAQL